MKFGLLFANVGPFALPDGLEHLARTAETLGFESIWAIEHVVIPVGYESKYPYDPSGKLPVPDNAPLPDPLINRIAETPESPSYRAPRQRSKCLAGCVRRWKFLLTYQYLSTRKLI